MKKVLLIAFHFPPVRVSSGIQRTLSMARYLRENGWEPVVLTISPQAYEAVSDDQLKDIPEGVRVIRAFGRDTARFFSVSGRYPGILALPDRWVSWFPAAVLAGLRLIAKEKPDVIWSTYPIASTHLIGWVLARLTGLPWVADFRDSMTEENYPSDKMRWRVYRWIEKKAVYRANKVVFTAPSALRMYADRYPGCDVNKFQVIPNGFDEDIFKTVEQNISTSDTTRKGAPVRLLHSGVLYPSERDPTYFFAALGELKKSGSIDSTKINILLRATGHDPLYQPQILKHNIEDIVFLESGVSYEEALSEMLEVDGLLLFQAKNCNHQIPAKLYEYFRTGKPIIALTDKEGDTAEVIREAGVEDIFSLCNKDEIKEAVLKFIKSTEFRENLVVSSEHASNYSRASLVKDYGKILNKASQLAEP